MNKEIWNKIFLEKKTWGKYPSEYLVRDVINFNKNKTKIKILELGCGPGANFLLYFKEKISFDALDISKIAIKKSKIILDKSAYKKANLINSDFSYIENLKKKYDLIIDSASLCYVSEKNFKKLLIHIHRILNKGGIFWSRTFGRETTGFNKNDNFITPKKGPIRGHGKTRVISKKQIKRLYGSYWKKIEFEEIFRITSKKHIIQEFIIKSKK